MEKIGKKLLVIMMALVMVMSMGVSVFAYTAVDDDGDRASEEAGTFGVVASNSGMLRNVDEGTTVKLSEDKTKVDITVKTKASKTWGKITKLALIEASASDEEKEAAAANVTFDDDTLDIENAKTRVFHYSIPLNEIGKMIPACVYVYNSETKVQEWKTYNTQSYLIALWTRSLYQEIEAAAETETDETIKAELDKAVKAGIESLAFKELQLEKRNKVMMTVNSALLYKVNGKYLVDLVLDGTSFDKVFVGYASEANKDDKGAIKIENDADNEVSYVTIPVEELGKEIVYAFHGSKYYNRSLTVTEDKLIYDNTNISLEEFDNMTEEEAIARAESDTSVETVNKLIEAIQSQKRDENTDKYCAIAKAYYDALSDRDKKKLDDPGYFGDDTGDASLDDPRNADGIGKKELMVVSFGTSFNGSRVATVKAVEDALQKAFPKYQVRRAFTAQIIINHIQARDGEKIDNMDQALDRAVANGVEELVVQPTHLMSGAEYDEMCAALNKYKGKIKTISICKPLLHTDEDKEIVAKAVVAKAAEDAKYASVEKAVTDPETAFVFMGHGTDHSANSTYTFMQQTMDKLGYKNCFIGTVEGKPAETEVEAVLARVKDAGYKKVILRPLMVVAGDHANNDMAGDDEDSWKSIFGAALGADNVSCQINGLGEIKEVQDLYVKHVRETVAAVEEAKTKAEIAKVKAGKIKSFKAKAGKKKVTFAWKKNTTFAGYQLKYKAGKKSKTLNIKSAKTVKKIVKKLKKGTKVTAQIRGYKKIAGKTYYGKWAKSKAVKVK